MEPNIDGRGSKDCFRRFSSAGSHHGLRSLRLTCRSIAAKVLRTYSEAHFASRTIMFCDKQSILNAVGAAEHEAFGRYLRKLTIIVDEAYPEGHRTIGHPLSAACSICDAGRKPYSKAARKEDLELLLWHMSKHGKPVELTFLESAHLPPGKYSTLDAYRSGCSRVRLDSPMGLGNFQLGTMLGAARDSNLKISRLAIRTDIWAVSLYHTFFCGPRAKDFEFVLQHLRQFELHYRPCGLRSDYEATSALHNALCSAPKLERLKLHLQEALDGSRQVFDKRLLHRPMSQLKEFHLVAACVLMSDLQQFVDLNPTLRKVDLTRVDFMRGSFSDDLLGEFHIIDAEDIHGPVRQLMIVPGDYDDLWSDDVALMRGVRSTVEAVGSWVGMVMIQ
ncbi:unnamed protein product [Cercospora beticola]|nr:unnamed protein product [Cercospora beticola]